MQYPHWHVASMLVRRESIKNECGKIQSAEMQFLWRNLNYTLQDRIRNEDIRAELEVKDINEIISIYRRHWWDLQRMTEDRLPKAALNYKATGRREHDEGGDGCRNRLYNLIVEEEKKKKKQNRIITLAQLLYIWRTFEYRHNHIMQSQVGHPK